MVTQNDITLEYYSYKPISYLEYFFHTSNGKLIYLKFPTFHCGIDRGKSQLNMHCSLRWYYNTEDTL